MRTSRANTQESRKRLNEVALLLAVALGLFVLGGCILERPNGVTVRNDLSDSVEIVYLKDSGILGGRLEPGVTRIFEFDLYQPGKTDKESCTTADIVAKSRAGTVIARVPAPRCIGATVRLSDWLVP